MAQVTKPGTKKATKPAAAKQPAAKPAAKEDEEGVRAQHYAQKIKALFTSKEHDAGETKDGKSLGRPGTKAHKSRGLYLKCKTVGEYKEAGGDMGYLHNDPERGLVEVK